jgi:hypothetical protein
MTDRHPNLLPQLKMRGWQEITAGPCCPGSRADGFFEFLRVRPFQVAAAAADAHDDRPPRPPPPAPAASESAGSTPAPRAERASDSGRAPRWSVRGAPATVQAPCGSSWQQSAGEGGGNGADPQQVNSGAARAGHRSTSFPFHSGPCRCGRGHGCGWPQRGGRRALEAGASPVGVRRRDPQQIGVGRRRTSTPFGDRPSGSRRAGSVEAAAVRAAREPRPAPQVPPQGLPSGLRRCGGAVRRRGHP